MKPRNIVASLAFLLAASCGGDHNGPTGPGAVPFAGTFTLRTMNGQNLPFVVLQSGQNLVRMVSDQIVVSDGGSWSESFVFSVVQNGITTSQVGSDQGTWLRSGNNILLSSSNPNNAPYSGTFTNTELDVTDGAFAYVFKK